LIELSVALPIYKGKNIAWLALESLCRQKEINFEWELIVIEEEIKCFSKEELMKYSDRLKELGCVRISYTLLKKRIPLSQKWKMIGNKVGKSSKVCVLQAADCYSQPYRLVDTYKLIVEQDYDYVSCQIGPFYDIPDDNVVVYDKTKQPIIPGLNMAIKSHFIKNLPTTNKRSGLDGWIVSMSKKSGKKFVPTHINNNHWKMGVDTNGMNNISFKRHIQMKNHKNYNRSIKISLDEILPKDIVKKLRNCVKYCMRKKRKTK